ncbi:MAG: signal peptidase I [Actinomycetota bacterium]
MKTDAERSALAPQEPEASAPAGSTPPKHQNRVLHALGELPGLILTALILALLIKTFLVQAFFIPSPSMSPTLKVGDRVLVSQVPYYLGDPERYDIIVFEEPHPTSVTDRGVVSGFVHWLSQGLGVSQPDHEDFIKRVIGLPGDTVWARKGDVFVNGDRLDEPYVVGRTADFPKTKVPEGNYFVMGDNRENSMDSRFSLGFIPEDKIIGEAFMIVWPPSRMSGL